MGKRSEEITDEKLKMKNCVFCKIVLGEFDSAKIWEDEEFLAILDLNPNTKGMTLIMPKKHYNSYVVDMPEGVYSRYFIAVKKAAKLLEKSLEVKRVALVMEGLGVNHAHIKLYPIHGLKDTFEEIWAKEKVFFDKYPGYISTILGPKKDLNELKKLAEEIKKS